MRCKNCGSENNDNLYICQNCGSPLYDENNDSDTKAINPDELDKFNSMTRRRSSQPPAGKDVNDDSGNGGKNKDKKNQQMVAVIIILAVLLVAIIIGIVAAVAGSKSDDKGKEDSSISSSLPDEEETTDQKLKDTTSKESTTEKTTSKTTSSTTTTTTTTTTQAVKFTVTLSCTDGGEVEGDGEYSNGEAVTVIARPDDGYDFDGWYSAGSKVSDNTKYKFTVNSDKSLEAKFVPVGEDFDVINGVDE